MEQAFPPPEDDEYSLLNSPEKTENVGIPRAVYEFGAENRSGKISFTEGF